MSAEGKKGLYKSKLRRRRRPLRERISVKRKLRRLRPFRDKRLNW
jgi:hypothetical protein